MKRLYVFNGLMQQRVSTTSIESYNAAMLGDVRWLTDANFKISVAHSAPTLSENLEKDSPKSKVVDAAFRYLNRGANRTTPFGFFVAHRAYVSDRSCGERNPGLPPRLATSLIITRRSCEGGGKRLGEQRASECDLLLGLQPTMRRDGSYYVWEDFREHEQGNVRRAKLRATVVLDHLFEQLGGGRIATFSGLVDEVALVAAADREKAVAYVQALIENSLLRSTREASDFFEDVQKVESDFFSSDDSEVLATSNGFSSPCEQSTRLRDPSVGSVAPDFIDLCLSHTSELHLESVEIRQISEALNVILATSSVKAETAIMLERWTERFADQYGFDIPVPLLEALDPYAGIGPVLGYQYPPPAESQIDVPHVVWDSEDLTFRLEMYGHAVRSGRTSPVDLSGPEFAERLESIESRFDGRELYPDFDLSLTVATVGSERRFLCRSDALALGGHSFTRARATMDVETKKRWNDVLGNLSADEGCTRLDLYSEPALRRLGFQVAFPGQGSRFTSTEVCNDAVPMGSIFVWANDAGMHAGVRDCDGTITPVATNFPTLLVPMAFRNEARLLMDVSRARYRLAGGFSWAQLEGADWLPEVRYGNVVLRPAEWRITEAMRAAARSTRRTGNPSPLRSVLAREDIDGEGFYAAGDNRLHFDTRVDYSLMLLARLISSASLEDRIERSSLDSHRGGRYVTENGHRRYSTELILSFSRRRKLRKDRIASLEAPFWPGMNVAQGWLTLVLRSEMRWMDELVARSAVASEEAIGSGRIDSWHFVRYNDDGCSLRVRWHASSPKVSIFALLRSLAERCAQELLIRSWSVRPYIPEQAKYGAGETLSKAHEAFMLSSRQAVSLVKLREGSKGVQRHLMDLECLASYAFRLCSDLNQLCGALPRAERPTELAREVWRDERKTCIEIVRTVVREGGISRRKTVSQNHMEGMDDVSRLANLMHMHCNRMQGSGDTYETDMYWLLRKALVEMERL